MSPTRPSFSTSTPVSSRTSRRAVSSMDSPSSGVPFGRHQRPSESRPQRSTSRSPFSTRNTTPPAENTRSVLSCMLTILEAPERVFVEGDLFERLLDGVFEAFRRFVEDPLEGDTSGGAADLAEGVDGGEAYLAVGVFDGHA